MDRVSSPKSGISEFGFLHVFVIANRNGVAVLSLSLSLGAIVLSLSLLAVCPYFDFRTLEIKSFLSQIIPGVVKQSTEVCDYSNGRWIWDVRNPPLYYTESCRFLDPGFRCRNNGRKDDGYLRWRWKPHGCDLPKFEAGDVLKRSRNGRIVFVGDSLGRNQWESMICMLSGAVSNQSTIYEENGNPITKHKGFLSVRFEEQNLTVEYYRAPFLVEVGRPPANSSTRVKLAVMLDRLHWYSKLWVGADVLIFNGGHWWNKDKTVKIGSYFHEGGKVNTSMDALEAYRRSMQTWKSWVLNKLDPHKSHVFFRAYSPSHYRGGTWEAGGGCEGETMPETTEEKKTETENPVNGVIKEVVKELKAAKMKVWFLNVTYLSELRKDGHPSVHREPGTPLPLIQDCSHWCLPGIPDSWNCLLHSYLTI